MKTIRYVVTSALIAGAFTAAAQLPRPSDPVRPPAAVAPPDPGPPRADILLRDFFAPELIMQHQKALNLTAEQQSAIKAEMQKSLSKFTDLQWQQAAAEETLRALLRQERPDEAQILAQFDELLAVENQIKKLHLSMLIRVKNLLTADQQALLRKLRSPPPPAGGRGTAPRTTGLPPPPPME